LRLLPIPWPPFSLPPPLGGQPTANQYPQKSRLSLRATTLEQRRGSVPPPPPPQVTSSRAMELPGLGDCPSCSRIVRSTRCGLCLVHGPFNDGSERQAGRGHGRLERHRQGDRHGARRGPWALANGIMGVFLTDKRINHPLGLRKLRGAGHTSRF